MGNLPVFTGEAQACLSCVTKALVLPSAPLSPLPVPPPPGPAGSSSHSLIEQKSQRDAGGSLEEVGS